MRKAYYTPDLTEAVLVKEPLACLVLLVAAACVHTGALLGQPSDQARADDREQITAILRQWEDAWNTHDMSAFADLFHEDGVWILWTGQVWTGRRAIEEGHAEVHRTVFRNSVQRERLEELTFVGPDAAVVRFYSTLTGDERAPERVIESRKILVVPRRAGAWKIGWGQNTRLAETAPPQAADGSASDANHSSARMADGRQWTTENLRLSLPGSYCYADVARNCEQYGRLYTWEAAQRGCQALGAGWRLPADEDWRALAQRFGGVFDDSPDDRGKEAYDALLRGGGSGFDALLGGGRASDGRYDDLDAHGFYWTASSSEPAGAWYYNFGRGSDGLYRQSEGEKAMALAVRCIR